mgnify:CR=1 FL=1
MDEDEEDVTAMRVYGLDNNNENVCVRIDNFTPFVYLELPENVPWTASKAQQVGNKLDTMLGDRKPLVKRLMYKKRLYYAHLDQKGRRKKFPYLFLSFSHQSDIRNMSYKIRRPLNIIGIGNIKVKMHEQDASPILQFVSYRNVSTAGWIDFVGKRIGKDDQITRCDHEFKVRWKNVTPNTIPTVAAPLIMGFDIEVNSTNPSAMPKAEKPGDKVFQISCVLFRHGDDEKNMEKCLLTLGEPDPKTVGEDTEIYMYETEHDLLIGYTEFIQEKNPNIIVGYNILNFDIPYMIDRAKMNYCIFDFDQQGFNRYGHAKEKTIKWSSSAYGNQTFQFLDAEGRLYVDLLPLVKRDYKMDNYKLKTISTFFLGCVDPNTPILTWGGSKKLAKDIQIGDELIGDDGTKRTVQDICEGVDDMYEIYQHKFDNYIVNSQHILTFKISGHCSIYWLDKKKMWTMGWLDMNKRKFRFKSMSTTRTTKTKEDVYEDMVKYRNTLDTNDILEIKVKDYLTLPDSVKNKLKGYKTSGVQWKHQDVPIDPYIFGMWLGDGDSDGRGFASQDKELIEKWESWCSNNNAKFEHSKRYNYRIKHISGKRCTPPLKTILKKHELFNNKHIPSIYLQNDRKTRLSLLAGLIDTDGYVGSNGRCIIITQVRKELSEQILYLARSLGMSAFCKKRHTKWTWNNETKYGYAYEVAISGEGLEDIPTILGYKKCLKRQQKKDALVSGIKITHIGKGPFNGWQIDGNERFLLGDFTVTHNSTKDPLSVKGIFKCYRIGIKNKDGVYSRQAQKAMGIVGKYCLCENTRVSGKHGSIPIENLYGENLEVLSWNEKTDKLEISVQSNFFDNGKKECIELELEDGRTIICTPDHKLVTENGWINADDIPVGGKVKVGPILPEVELDTNETIYARVLGYMITDGHISKQRCVGYFGNLLDAQVFCDDIKTLCGIKPEIRKKSLDNCWLVSLPKNMKYKLLTENWIKGGNRTGSKELLPDVSKWSKSQIREFIAGMFGGDGWCPCYNKGDDKFTPIGLTQSRNNKNDIDEYVEKLSNMLKMFDISSSIRIAKRDNLFIGSLSLSMHDIEKFVTTIGYRYCYHKTIRSSIATFYYRIKNKAIRAYKQFYDQVITSDMSIAGAYREYVNRYTYAPTYGTMKSWARKGFPTGRPDQACRSFPKVGQFLNRINVIKLFEGDDYHSYSLDKNCDTLPTFELSLISKKSVGIKQVYDITVEDTHSFLANGIVAHNCVQDSALVIRLFNKLQTWIGLCEMAKTCNVPIFYLYTQGQQIKVYSQLYKYCFTEDTKVSLVHGNVPIKMLEKNKDKVLSWDEKTDQIIQSKQVRFFNNGKHDCISLEFEDGRTITCTPDHLFADTNGKWIKAFDIKLGSRVKIGPVLPDVSIDTYETILARILGYIVTDGHMSKHRNKSCAFLGTLLDADIFANDIEKLCRFKPKIKKDTCKSNCFTVGIPVKVVDMINNIDGIYCGNRTTSSNTCLPTDLAYWNKDRLREFLGGLFGGDGWSCSYNKITNSFTQVGFTQSRTGENCLQDYFQILASCLEKFDIQSKYNIILKNNNYVGSLIIQGTQNLYNFVDKIGYRYCYNKTMRTSVAYMYYKLKDRVKKDKQDLFNRILSLKNSGLTITMAYKKAIQNIPTSEYMPTVKSYIRYIKNGFVPHTNIVSYKFIKVSEFIELTGSNKCFMNEESYHSHQITKTQTYIPTFSLKLVGRKEELKQTVYDIEVENTHSFMANGVVVHNCMYKNFVVEKDGYVPKDNEHYVGATVFEPKAGVYDRVIPFDFASLYPTTIIAYNIDYSTLVTDPSVPDSDCHVMEWEDHVGCLTKGTKITLGEYSMNIEDLTNYSDKILAYDGKNGLDYFNQTNFFDQGMKECIELTFNDGSTLKCTPDHRLLVGDGQWVEAQDIKLCQDKVNIGYSPPVYDISDKVLVIDDYVFRGRELIIFYKLLGLLCADGYCTKGRTILYSGHQIDIQNITRDLEYITKDKKSYSIRKENYGWGIVIKGRFGEILRDLDGMLWGKKSTQKRTLPSILKNASKGELCAFLSGLMGGDGHTFSFSEKAQSLGSIKLSWTSEDENILDPIFNQLQEYFTKCGVQTSVYRIKTQTFIGIKSEDTLKFQEKIGFSYCVHKSMRLEAGCSYLRYREKTWEQQKYIVERVSELKTTMSLEDATKKVVNDVKTNFPVYNEYYANPSKSQIIDLLRAKKKWDKPMFSREHFPGPIEYMTKINALNIFDSYGVNKEEKSLPCIQKTVIYKQNIGIQQTYDLEVESSHSFVADGIVVHNCEHDKSVRKTKPKHVMCDKRYFRFLKEPKGVMPTVLQNLLDARAHTRKQIKVINKILDKKDIDEKECKMVEELIPDVLKILTEKKKIATQRKDELKTLTEVLEKRQLAYKVSANSMYGAMGVTRGYLPFMPGAMATTAMGRKNIGIVAETIPKKFGGKLIYGDTDTLLPDSPLIVKNKNGDIEYRTMEELSNGDWKLTITGKEISPSQDGLLVWSDVGFTPIKYVIRHAITKPLIRVTTHVGSVECTLDHSLLWENGEVAKASDVKIGSKLCISEMPLPIDTPETPIYPNNLTNEKIKEYIIPDVFLCDSGLSAELAFAWGLFYADGSCGKYGTPSGIKTSWAINNKDDTLLDRCLNILNKHEQDLNFIIIDTMKSSGVNKLVPRSKNTYGCIVPFVNKYRNMFYDQRRSKRIPNIIFNSPFEIRQSFFMGYYAGDGSKKDPAISCSNKGAIGSAGLFYLMKTIGYKVSVNVRKDKPNIYKLTGSTPKEKFRYCSNQVKKIEPTSILNSIIPLEKPIDFIPQPEYIYDIETENHHFAAGVGQLVVHNSNYIVFPHLETAAENWDHALHVATEMTKMFPAPICLEFENEIYWRFFILTKKRYMYKKCMRDGVVDEKIGKKGVLLARRDNSMFIRNAYETLIMMVFNRKTREEILFYIIDIINKLCSHFYSYKDFIVTKSIGSHGGGQVVPFINEKGQKKGKMGDYTVPLLSTEPKERERQFKLKNCNNAKDYYTHCLPAVVQLAERMRQRGQRVDPGTRLEYVISDQGGHKAKQYVKVEDAIYFSQHSSVLKLDYMYYMKLMANPFDDVLNVLYNVDDGSKNAFQKDFVLKQYKFRLNVRTKVLNELKDLIAHTVTFGK